MKLARLAIVLIMAVVAVVAVTKGFSAPAKAYVVADASSSSDDGGDEGEYTEFA
jgi:hypothetical protein